MRACNIFVSRIAPFGADEMAHRAFWTWIPLAALLLTGPPAASQFPAKLTNLKVLEKDCLQKTVALYHDLRGKYYGSGQYDFSEAPLNQHPESLLAKKNNADALAIIELNFAANHPDSPWYYHMLAQAHEANGEVDKSIADYRKVLELHPDDKWAKQQIDSLSKNK